jgi:competence/damage-inducible protein CinA-like protein
MKAEIIAVGSELLTPDKTDTNSLFITERLNEAGFDVRRKTVIGDNEEDLANLIGEALSRSVLIVISGGLGPTEDDVTRQAVSRVLQKPLVINGEVLEEIRGRFASRGIAMPEINTRQAQVLQGAEVLANPRGTAPGMWIEEKAARIVLLPGPPRELQAMFLASVTPRLSSLHSGRQMVRRTVSIVGLSESEVDSRVSPIYTTYPGIATTILASCAQITLNLTRWLMPGETAGEVDELTRRIAEALGDTVYSTSGETLEEVAGRLLRDSGKSLAVAESCTSGAVATRITRIPGSSDYFLGGVLCYANEVKERICGVPASLIERYGAVSAEVAEALAQGVRRVTNSSIGLSVTGIAGPGGGSAEKPVGLVYFGLADAHRSLHERRIIPGDRESVRERAATYALASLRRFLLFECRGRAKP